MELCKVCGKNETGRLMDIGGEKLPVCGECLVSGRWRELIPKPLPDAPESTPEVVKEIIEPVTPAPMPKKRKRKK